MHMLEIAISKQCLQSQKLLILLNVMIFQKLLLMSSTRALEVQKKYMLDIVLFVYSTQTMNKTYQSELVC
jgi:hypothetical protein